MVDNVATVEQMYADFAAGLVQAPLRAAALR